MPQSKLLEPVLAAGAAVAGGVINAFSGSNLNKKNRAFSREMYARQRADALGDWVRTNDYNSPQAQMQRLQEAGLNPNMVYGQSSGGASGSASPISHVDMQTPQTRTPEWGNGLANAGLVYMNAMYDLDIKQAQTDNLRAQNNVIVQDAALKLAQTRATMTAEQRARFDLEYASEMRPYSAEMQKAQLHKLKTDTDLSIRRDVRESVQTASSLNEVAEKILSMQETRRGLPLDRAHTAADTLRIKATIDNMKKEGILRDFDIELRKNNINPNDPMWARMVSALFDKAMEIEPGDIGMLRAWMFQTFGR